MIKPAAHSKKTEQPYVGYIDLVQGILRGRTRFWALICVNEVNPNQCSIEILGNNAPESVVTAVKILTSRPNAPQILVVDSTEQWHTYLTCSAQLVRRIVMRSASLQSPLMRHILKRVWHAYTKSVLDSQTITTLRELQKATDRWTGALCAI